MSGARRAARGGGELALRPPRASVYSAARAIVQPALDLPEHLSFNARLRMNGLEFLEALPERAFPAAFLDPQYRGVLDHLSYGNEGDDRGRRRRALPQMTGEIPAFVQGIDRALIPSGHLFLWVDKFHVCTGVHAWFAGTELEIVDMLTWDKRRFGMGYRSRRVSEHVLVLQKRPRKAKGVWTRHDIPDVWPEPAVRRGPVHRKPVDLQGALIEAVTNAGDTVVDPAAGSFSVLDACRERGRNFLGCDVNG